MLALPSVAEAESLATEVCTQINESIPKFDVKQADPDLARFEHSGNCFAMTVNACVILETLQVPYFFRQQSGIWFDERRFHHADAILPVSDENKWGVVIDMVSKAKDGEHMQVRPYYYRPISKRQKDIQSMVAGKTITVTDVIPSFGTCRYRTALFAVGHAEYCRRTGLTNRGQLA